MFEVQKTFRFEAGHQLVSHEGVCRRPHGHSYMITVHVRGESLHEAGAQTNMLCDFHALSAAVQPILNEFFDHQWLNETLRTDAPTAEFIARWIYDKLKPSLPLLYSITVAETDRCSVTYWSTTSVA